jgi:hypothetical protein
MRRSDSRRQVDNRDPADLIRARSSTLCYVDKGYSNLRVACKMVSKGLRICREASDEVDHSITRTCG